MKLLVTGATQFGQEQINIIKEMGHDVIWQQHEKDCLNVDYSEIEGVIGNGLFLYHGIERFTNLKYIQLTSAGFDRVPMEYISSKQIEIHNAKDVYSIPMAEFVMASVLQIYKQMQIFRKNQSEHLWEKNRNLIELYGKEVCIIGCGSVGTECAKRFQAFGCNVTGIVRQKKTMDFYDRIESIEVLDCIIPQSDIVILSLPLTAVTKKLFGESIIQSMKKESILINVSRGPIIDMTALEKRLQINDMYAVLDVFDAEPLNEESKLWDMENVNITPHNSFVGEKNTERLFQVTVNNLLNWSK